MSMQGNPSGNTDGSSGQGLTGNQHGNQILNPLGNRSLSPANYQQLQSQMHQQ